MDALVTAPGNTAVVQRIPIPEPGPNEIRIKVHSVALNPVDAFYVAHPQEGLDFGRVVGSDVAGVVEKLGPGVREWKVGDRAAAMLQGATSANPRPGGFAEYAILEEDLAIHVPDALSFDEAATLPMGTLTAAQALFIRLGINAPFPDSPYTFPAESLPSPTILIYSAATSIGLYAIEFAQLLRTPSGTPYRIFATASPKHHAKLLSQLGVEAVFDYRSETWEADVRAASGGIAYAFDCISEGDSAVRISKTFREGGGTIAMIRKFGWDKEGIREDVKPWYGAAWMGLGHEIVYNKEVMPASKEWRALTVALFKFLSGQKDVVVKPNPVRVMPGGLKRIVQDGFRLLGAGRVGERAAETLGGEEWMRPISGEKLVYRVGE